MNKKELIVVSDIKTLSVRTDALCDASWDAWLLQYAMRNGGN